MQYWDSCKQRIKPGHNIWKPCAAPNYSPDKNVQKNHRQRPSTPFWSVSSFVTMPRLLKKWLFFSIWPTCSLLILLLIGIRIVSHRLTCVQTGGPKMKAFEYTVRGNSQESYALCSFLLSIKGFIHKLRPLQYVGCENVPKVINCMQFYGRA